MENNTLLIVEENDDSETATSTSKNEEDENTGSRLKLAMKNKKLKEDFFKESRKTHTVETMNEDYENEIDKSILDLEDNASLVYSSDEEDGDSLPSNGTLNSDENGEYDVNLLEKSSLRNSSYGQQVPSILLPFYERRRLSECKEESETDEESEVAPQPAITVTSTNGITHQTEVVPKKRFVVTKANDDHMSAPNQQQGQQPVSILKKTPSPPSHQKLLHQQSPKKIIRYEAEMALKDYSAKNSHTIHFPCSPSAINRTNIKNIFSPQGTLNPHLDKRYFDTSLVEVRTSQNQLATSTKSLDDSGSQPLNDVWIKRTDFKHSNAIYDKISVSSDSITSSKSGSRKADVSCCGLRFS